MNLLFTLDDRSCFSPSLSPSCFVRFVSCFPLHRWKDPFNLFRPKREERAKKGGQQKINGTNTPGNRLTNTTTTTTTTNHAQVAYKEGMSNEITGAHACLAVAPYLPTGLNLNLRAIFIFLALQHFHDRHRDSISQ